MHPILRNLLAIVAGFAIGSMINMALVMLGHQIVPPPQGFDMNDPESLAKFMPLFETRHFVFPWLAHGLGTLAGSFAAYKIAATHKAMIAYVIGAIFLAGGIYMVVSVPSPIGFTIVDLGLAYLPMAWLGQKLASK